MKRLIAVVAVALFAAAAVLWLSWTNEYFQQLNAAAYDFTLRLAGPIEPSSPTLIVAIDQESLDRFGRWPWSRHTLGELIREIAKGRPAVIAVDIVLDDFSADDTELAAAIGDSGPIVLGTHIGTADQSHEWLKPQPVFIQPNVRLGHVHADPDLGGVSRQIFSAKVAGEGTVFPAFSFEALRAAGVPIDSRFEEAHGVATIVRPQTINVRFAGEPGTFPHVPAWQVLEGSAPPDRFRNHIVLIGSTAEGIGDQWFTPFSAAGQRMAGVEIHANAIESLYSRRWISEAPGLIVFLALGATLVWLWWLDRRFEGVRFYTMALLLGPFFVAVSWALMKYQNTWFAFPPFLFAIVLAVPALEIRKVTKVNRDLDSKIVKLSRWGDTDAAHGDTNPAAWISHEVSDEAKRAAWLDMIDSFERERSGRRTERRQLLDVPWKSARWRLGAVDFFNEELVRFVQFNSAILRSIEDVIIVIDVRGRIVYQNPAAHRLQGFRADATFAPEYVSSLLGGRSFGAAFAEVLTEQKTVSMQFVFASDGKTVFHITMAPLPGTGLVLSMHDATAQHELNLAKNEMVSLVSHELRTPLTSIRGYSDMLMKYDLVQEKGKQFLGTIIEESQRLNSLIQSFLDVAYIESGRQKVSKTEFDLAPVFRDMLSILEPLAAQKKITLDMPRETDRRVRADRLLLYQALTNLVTNAIKYSPEGTVVRIAVSNEQGTVRFDVCDQGYGIPADEKNKIFEKFFRLANRETLEQSGFGLGLAFVKEVATRHGGDVTVESEVGKGSTFSLEIPS